MVNLEQAHKVILSNLPGSTIHNVIEYNDRYIFVVDTGDPDEAGYDPFYSVDQRTGKFAEFSIITGGDMDDIFKLFAENLERRRGAT